MKLKIEIDPSQPEELILRAPEVNDTVRRVQRAIDAALSGVGEISVRKGGEECFMPYGEFIYFEADGNRTIAHTPRDSFICTARLVELAELLPRCFVRASKSCLVNTGAIRSINRSPTGISEAAFNGSEKKIYISRMYYKVVREVIEETRLMK